MNLLSDRGEDSYAGWTILSFLGAGALTYFSIAVAAWNEKLTIPIFIGLLCCVLSTVGLFLAMWKVKSRKVLYSQIGLVSSSLIPALLVILFLQETFKTEFHSLPEVPIVLLMLFVLHSSQAVLSLIRLNQIKALSR
jgi:hypothetical protein